MTTKQYKYLTQAQVDNFMEYGYLKISKAFTPEKANEFTHDMWIRLGMDPEDQSTWTKNRINMPNHRQQLVQTFAPSAWEAICELLGGEERVDPVNSTWNDGLIVNLGTPEMLKEKTPHPRDLDNWHVDGDFFRHFLDSPEQALLVIPLFSDIKPRGGGTYIAPDGIDHIAKFLAENPQGVLPVRPDPEKGISGFIFEEIISKCEVFHEMTGELGDVVLMHPLMLHSASHNNLREPRVITNPPVSLHVDQPFNFARDDPADYSLVELKTIRALGADPATGGFKFVPTHERERIIPERLKVQNKMAVEEKHRMEESQARGAKAREQSQSDSPACAVAA